MARNDRPDVTAQELTELDIERISNAQASVEQPAVVVRPDRDNSGIAGMNGVLTSLPRATSETRGLLSRKGAANTSPPYAFEMVYGPRTSAPHNGERSDSSRGGERVITLQYVGADDQYTGLLERQLSEYYPQSHIETDEPATYLTPHAGQSAAVCTLALRRYTLYPLKNDDLSTFVKDPTGSILTEMVGAGDALGVDADVGVQVMLRPALPDWQSGVPGGYGLADEYGDGYNHDESKVTQPHSVHQLRKALEQPTYENRPLISGKVGKALAWVKPGVFSDEYTHDPSKSDKAAATMLSDLDGRGWEFHVRIVALSDDPDLAVQRCESVAEMFDNFYEYRGRQTFLPVPADGDDAFDIFESAVARQWPTDDERYQQIIKPQIEVAGLTNVPKADDVSTSKLRWSMSKPGEGVPPGTPRIDWQALGIDPANASKEEKQIALLDSDSPVTWVGLGAKHGVEVGIDYDNLTNPNTFAHGQPGVGKTTYLANRKSDSFRRGIGGLTHDPTGDDTEAILAEWPDYRPATDLIYYDLSGDEDRIPRFNFLEVPDYLIEEDGRKEGGSRKFDEYIESLADSILEMVGEAGGDDNYVGSLMKRVVKTVVRSMARLDVDATLFDVAAVCSSSDNLGRFANVLPEGHLDYLRTRVRSLAERKDSELDPLAGRLDEWVLNPNVRELICVRNPTFSIDQAVADRKEILVRYSRSGSDTVKHMVGNALIRRTYHAQRYHHPGVPYDLMVDEAQTILTKGGDIENIMDQGRKFHYRVTVACQRPSSQLETDVLEAVTANSRTVVSFDSNRAEDARAVLGQHDGIDADDLTSLSPYTFYTATETSDRESTYSYKVKAFRSPVEARRMLAEARGDDVSNHDKQVREKIRALKNASLEEYGLTRAEVDDTGSLFDGSEPTPNTEGADVPVASADGSGGTYRDSPDGTAGNTTHGPVSLDVDERAERAIVQAVYDTSIREGDPGGYVTVESARDAILRRLSREPGWPALAELEARVENPKDIDRRLLQYVRGEWLAFGAAGDATTLKARTPRKTILHIGEDQSAGGIQHALLIWDAYHGLTWAGVDFVISNASGTDPDFALYPAPHSEWNDEDVVTNLLGQEAADDPTLSARGEAEHSTGESAPAMTARHGLQAAQEGRPVVYLVRPDSAAARRVRNAVETPPAFCRTDHDSDGETWYYNESRPLNIGGKDITRPGETNTEWIRKSNGDIVCQDTAGTEWARFEYDPSDPTAHLDRLFTDASAYPDSGTNRITRPVIPEWYLRDTDGEPNVTIIDTPRDSRSLTELGITSGPDIPEKAEPLYDHLLAEYGIGEPFPPAEVKERVIDTDPDPSIAGSRATLYRRFDDLKEAGVLREIPGKKTETGGDLFSLTE